MESFLYMGLFGSLMGLGSTRPDPRRQIKGAALPSKAPAAPAPSRQPQAVVAAVRPTGRRCPDSR